MILNEGQVLDILRSLRNATAHNKLSWYSEKDRLLVDLPNRIIVELSQQPEGGLAAVVRREPEDVLGRVQLQPRQADEFNPLYEAAATTASRSIYDEILDAIKITDSVTVDSVRKLSPEVVADVRRKMAGRWHLDYSRGKETIRIDDNGAYFLEGKAEPTFHLEVLAVNDNHEVVEVAKATPAGQRRQIEYLTLTDRSMTGHAKHDGHKLIYRKINS